MGEQEASAILTELKYLINEKNGFVFAETIVVLTVVCVGLILLYSTFSTVLRREKVRSTYNQSVDIHNLNTIKILTSNRC